MTIQTKLLSGESGIRQTVELLKRGQCVAVPTETVYGLAADASNDQAVAGIYEAKGRPSNHPLIVHLANSDALPNWATNIPESVERLAEAFWPGPLTLLLRKAEHVSPTVTGGFETIAIRVPDHPVFHRVLAESQLGLAAPSANRYKKLSPTSADQVLNGMKGYISAVLDGGPCEFGLESTILDLTSTQPTIVRSGPIGRAALQKVLGCEVLLPKKHNVAVPGNVEAHYQPNARLQRVSQADMIQRSIDAQTAYVVCSTGMEKQLLDKGIGSTQIADLTTDPVTYAHDLYATLYQFDQLDFGEILVEATPETEDWAAINDRLSRAAT